MSQQSIDHDVSSTDIENKESWPQTTNTLTSFFMLPTGTHTCVYAHVAFIQNYVKMNKSLKWIITLYSSSHNKYFYTQINYKNELFLNLWTQVATTIWNRRFRKVSWIPASGHVQSEATSQLHRNDILVKDKFLRPSSFSHSRPWQFNFEVFILFVCLLQNGFSSSFMEM